MMNYDLINRTVKIVSDYYEAEGIFESNASIEAQAVDWYRHSEIVDALMLAAAVMNYGAYKPNTKWIELEHLRDFYFPNVSIDTIISMLSGEDEAAYDKYLAMSNFSIGEIEAAQNDARWW
jgi:hypothetical protein